MSVGKIVFVGESLTMVLDKVLLRASYRRFGRFGFAVLRIPLLSVARMAGADVLYRSGGNRVEGLESNWTAGWFLEIGKNGSLGKLNSVRVRKCYIDPS